MSLDVYLELETEDGYSSGSGIFIRDNGQTREITRAEWDERFPDREPVIAGDIETSSVFSANITHNLSTMADKAGLYKALWRPEEIGITKAAELIPLLRDGLDLLQSNPDHFKQFNPPNGWGDYDGLVQFVANYLSACHKHPDAKVSAWR